VAELYPPRQERWWEVAMGTMALCAAVVVEGIGAGWYSPKELRLER
jgi:hypothetical protein